MRVVLLLFACGVVAFVKGESDEGWEEPPPTEDYKDPPMEVSYFLL